MHTYSTYIGIVCMRITSLYQFINPCPYLPQYTHLTTGTINTKQNKTVKRLLSAKAHEFMSPSKYNKTILQVCSLYDRNHPTPG